MPSYDASQAQVHVFTFKDGLLSKIAHDLKIKVEKLSAEVNEGSLKVTVDATSLRVVCARRDGQDSPGTLSSSDKSKIEGNIQKDVLHTRRHANIRFESSEVTIDGDRATVAGTLTLHGTSQPLSVQATKSGDTWSAEFAIDQPRFGIKPYSAMMGTLKIQPVVRVRVEVPA